MIGTKLQSFLSSLLRRFAYDHLCTPELCQKDMDHPHGTGAADQRIISASDSRHIHAVCHTGQRFCQNSPLKWYALVDFKHFISLGNEFVRKSAGSVHARNFLYIFCIFTLVVISLSAVIALTAARQTEDDHFVTGFQLLRYFAPCFFHNAADFMAACKGKSLGFAIIISLFKGTDAHCLDVYKHLILLHFGQCHIYHLYFARFRHNCCSHILLLLLFILLKFHKLPLLTHFCG